MSYLTPDPKKIFTQLRQTFISTLIIYYLDLEFDIGIKINLLKYTINANLRQLISDLSQ